MSARREESELTVAKKNEKRLLEQNRELKRQISEFIKNEATRKSQKYEHGKMKRNVERLELFNDQLRNDLQNSRARLTNEMSKKTNLEQTNLDLESKNRDLVNRYAVEQSMRMDMEKRLEKFREINKEREKLAAENQALKHKIEQLSGYEHCICEPAQELRQLVRRKDSEHDKTKSALHEFRKENKHLKEQMELVMMEKEKLEGADKKAQELSSHIKIYQSHLDNEKAISNKLRRESYRIIDELETQRHYRVEAELRADGATEACKEKDLEIDSQRKESERQCLLIRELKEQINKYKTMEAEMRRLRVEILSQKVTGDLAIKNLFTAQTKISELERTNEALTTEILDKRTKVISQDSKIVKLERKYRCVKKQVERVKGQLSEAKQEMCVTLTDKIQAMTKEAMASLSAERDVLKKELEDTKNLLFTQQQKAILQEAESLKQKTEENETQEELKSVWLKINELEEQNKSLETEMLKKSTSRPTCSCRSTSKASGKRTEEQHDHCATCPQGDSEEIRELKRKLNEAQVKLREHQWTIRKLNDKIKALEGQSLICVKRSNTYQQKSYVLQEEMRNIKLDIWEKSNTTIMPKFQVTSGPKPPTSSTSKQTCFVLTSSSPQCESKDKSKTPFLPPIQVKNIQKPTTFPQPHRPSEGKSGHTVKYIHGKLPPQTQDRPLLVWPPLPK